MKRILSIIGGLVVVCAVIFAGIFGLAMFLTQGVADSSENFMKAVQEDRFEDAYALLTVALQDEVDMDTFEESFDPMEIASWSFNSRNVENNLGSVQGTASIGGSTYVVAFSLVNADGVWLIDGYQFTEAAEEDAGE